MTFDDIRMDVLRFVFSIFGDVDIEAIAAELAIHVAPELGEAVMTIEEWGAIRGRKEGHKEGREEQIRKTIINLVKAGMPVVEIAEIVEMAVDSVKQLLETESVVVS